MIDAEIMPPAQALAKTDTPEDVIELNKDQLEKRLKSVREFQQYLQANLKEGLDFGSIPGITNRNNLLQPGAEKIVKLLGLRSEYEIVDKIEDWEKPFFRYLFKCRLISIRSGVVIDEGFGECNSYESKYRYRWVPEAEVPTTTVKASLRTRGGKRTLFEFEFAIQKREAGGKYGKPADHWDMFERAIKEKKAVRVERETKKKNKEGNPIKYWGYELTVDQMLYRVENPEIFDQVNTMIKMSKKRSLVDAAKSAGRLSDLFTQDMEDLAEDQGAESAVHDEAPGEAQPTERPAEQPKEKSKEKEPKPKKEAAPEELSDIGFEELTEEAEGHEDPELKQKEEHIVVIKDVLQNKFGKDFAKMLPEFQRFLGEFCQPKMEKNLKGGSFVKLVHNKWFLEGGDLSALKTLVNSLDNALVAFDDWFKREVAKAGK